MSTISQDLKERIVRSVNEDGLNQAATARRFAVAESTVSRTMRAYRERGTVAPLEFVPGRSPKLGDEHLAWLRARLKESPSLSTYELTPLFNKAFPDVAVHRSTVLRAVHRLALSLKRGPHLRRPGSRKS